MRVERTHNAELVWAIMTDNSLWDRITTDLSPEKEDFDTDFVDVDGVYTLVVYDDEGSPGGVLLAHPLNATTYSVHIAMLGSHRGTFAEDAGHQFLDWLWNNTNIHKLQATVPVIYRSIIKYVVNHGFNIEGVLEESYLKNGIYHDEAVLGLKRV